MNTHRSSYRGNPAGSRFKKPIRPNYEIRKLINHHNKVWHSRFSIRLVEVRNVAPSFQSEEIQSSIHFGLDILQRRKALFRFMDNRRIQMWQLRIYPELNSLGVH